MAIAITRLRKFYMSKIDPEDLSAYENVQRYIDLVELYRQMQARIKDDGPAIKIENGNQSYIKSHPLISDMKNINAQLINLKKDIDKSIKDYELKAKFENKHKDKKYEANDLL